MSEIDSLDIQIEAQAERAIDSLDKLIGKLNDVKGALGNGGAAKAMGDSVKNVSSSVGSTMQKVDAKITSTTKKMAKSFDEIAAKVAHIGVGFRIEGAGKESIQKAIDSRTNQMATAMKRMQLYESNGETFSKGYEKAVQTFTVLGNEIDGLREQMKEFEFPAQPAEEIERIAERANKAAQGLDNMANEEPRFSDISLEDTLKNCAEYSNRVAEQIKEIENGMGVASKKFEMPDISANIGKITSDAMKLSDIFKNLKVTNADAGLDKVDAAIARTEQAYKRLADNMRIAMAHNNNYENTAAFDRQNLRADELRNQYARLIMMQEELSRAAERERVSTTFSRLSAGAKKAGSAITKLASKMAQLVKSMAKTQSASKAFDKLAGKLTHSLTKVGNMLKLMVTRMALRKVIENVGTGFKGLAAYSEEFNRSVSMLIGSLKTLGYSIAAAVGPMLNALAPAINKIIQMCTMAVNYINQLISALTGKSTWIRAKNQVVDYAKSVSGAGKAAKNTLLAIDELNNITSDTGGGGAGANDFNPGDMYETADIEDRIMKLSDKIKEMFDSGDFTELGSMIGESFKKGLDSIPWDKFKAGAEKAGKSLGTLITGFVKVEGLGASFGKTAAEAINTLTAAVKGFVDNTDFRAIGEFLGDSINGFLDNLNTDDIGHNIGEILKGGFDLAIGLLEKTDWKKLGNKIADIIANVDWTGVANKLYEGMGAALGALSAFILGLIEDAWKSVVSWWERTAYEDGEFTMEGLLNGINDALSNIDNWIKSNIFDPFIDGFAKAFGINASDGSKEMLWEGQKLILGLCTGINVSTPSFEKAIDKIKDVVLGVWENIKTKTAEIWTSIKDAIKVPINGIIGFINGLIQAVSAGINGLIDKLNSLSFDIPSWVPEWGGKKFGLNIPKVNVPVIPTLAAGGFVDSFSLFAAGENGIPEMLGTINGRNAVAGGAEITGIRDAILQSSSAELVMLREQNQLLQGILEKEYGISKSDIGKAARDYGKDYYNRTGNNAYVF
jgi:hypothetical protein